MIRMAATFFVGVAALSAIVTAASAEERTEVSGKVVKIGVTGNSHRLAWEVKSGLGYVRIDSDPESVCVFDGAVPIALTEEGSFTLTGAMKKTLPSGAILYTGCRIVKP